MRDLDHRNKEPDGHKGPESTSRHRGSSTVAMASAQATTQLLKVDDVEKYLVHIAHLDMALPLKIELIRSLRVMMQSFVDRAFGDDPVQLAGNKDRNKSDTGENGDVISSPAIPTNHDNLTSGFRRIAEPCEEKETDR